MYPVDLDTGLSAKSIASCAVLSHTVDKFLGSFGMALSAGPLRVERLFLSLQTLHPAFRARTYLWEKSSPVVKTTEWQHGLANRPGYRDSPDFNVHNTWMELRVRDLSSKQDTSCDLYGELASGGYTDYFMIPMFFSDGTVNTLSIATKLPRGFPSKELSRHRQLSDVLSIVFERYSAIETVNTTLETYFGRGVSQEILSGQIESGYAESISAAILFADLRDFTGRAARLDPKGTAKLLNDYFDCLVEPIEDRGGMVLKFIGDAVLAFFPLKGRANDPDPIGAAMEIRTRLASLNRDRESKGRVRLQHALCLHYGSVLYGNIGSSGRLDFTIVGEAVNIAARGIEAAKALSVDYLFTENLVERFGTNGLEPIGRHKLRGMAGEVGFFTYAEKSKERYRNNPNADTRHK